MMIDQEDPALIHDFFGLSYSTHLVLPRVLLQSMPEEWQARFVKLMEEYYSATREVEQPEHYIVKAATQHEAWEVAGEQLGEYTITFDSDSDGYWDEEGNALYGWQRVLVPAEDPLPSYSRGRTQIPLVESLE